MGLAELEASARELGRVIAGAVPKSVGFVLVLNDIGEGGFMTYLSNNLREDCIRMLDELLQKMRVEGTDAPTIDPQKTQHIMRRMIKAFHRSGIHPSPVLGDGCLVTAAVMFEPTLTKPEFLARASEAWDSMVGAGQPQPGDIAAMADLLNSDKKN